MQQDPLQSDHYRSLSGLGQSEYKDRGSKFIGLAGGAESIGDFEQHLAALKKQYHDARHFCYAYRLQPQQPLLRLNDDGEPAHSAGSPIFQALQAAELWDAWVVVLRYFGGTKLGVSGLVQAYKSAAAAAIAAASSEERFIEVDYLVRFPYTQMGLALEQIKDPALRIVEEQMGSDAGYRLRMRLGAEKKIIAIFDRLPFLSYQKIE